MPTIDIIPTKEAGDGFMAQCSLPTGERHYTFISGSLLRSRNLQYPARFWNDIRYIDGKPENGEVEVADRELSYGRFAQQHAFVLEGVALYERCEASGYEPLAREDGTIVPSCIMYNCTDKAPGYLSEVDMQAGQSAADFAAVPRVAAKAPAAPTPVPTDTFPAVPHEPAVQAAQAAPPAIDMQALAAAIAAALAAQQ